MARHPKHQKPQSLEIERLVPSTVPWYRKRMIIEHQQRYEFVQSYIKNASVGDIACGSGYGSYAMATHAKKVFGIDNSKDAIQYAQDNYSQKNITYIATDACQTTLTSSMLDVVISFETIEHLKNPEAFLREIKRILKDTGILILSTPNKTFSVGTNHFHYYEYSSDELLALLYNYFPKVTLYGQREVTVSIFRLLRYLAQQVPFFRALLPFRFWEPISITKLKQKKTNYVYLIAVCKQ